MHGGDVYVNPEQGYDFPTRWYVRPALRWTLRHAGALTAITEDCRQHALRAGAPGRVASAWSSTAPISAGSARAENGKPRATRGSARNMIFACRQLFPRKGIRFLVEAAAQLKPRFPDLKVVLAGDGFERPELVRAGRASSASRADVTFLGWVPNTELPPYYRAAARVGDSVAGGGVRHSRGGGHGLRGGRSSPATPAGCRRWWSTASPGSSCPAATRTALAEAIGSLLADPGAARGGWARPAGSGRSGSSTGIGPRSSSSRSTAKSAPGCAGERAAVRVSLGRRSSRLRHRRAAPDPRGLPRLRRAQHLLRQHGPVHQPPRVAGQGHRPLEGQAGRPGGGPPHQEDRLAAVPAGDRAGPAGRALVRARCSRRCRPKATSSVSTAAWIT